MNEPVRYANALPISTRTLLDRDGTAKRTLHVYCPLHAKTIGIETCVDCPHCVSLDEMGTQFRPTVTCSCEAPPSSARARPVGSVLARYSVCVRVGASSVAAASIPVGELVPVVDADAHFIGVMPVGPCHVVTDGVAIEEHEPVASALSTMARAKVRRAPVIAADGTVVGAVDDLDALRALRGVA